MLAYGASPRGSLGLDRRRPRARTAARARLRDPVRRRRRRPRGAPAPAGACPTRRWPTAIAPESVIERVLAATPQPVVTPSQYGATHRPVQRYGAAGVTAPRHRVHPPRRLTGAAGLRRAERAPHEAPEDIDARLRRLELMISRRLEGLLHGDHLGLLPGHGSERAESREYRLGDDVRRMDWAVTARTTRAARQRHDRRPRADHLRGRRPHPVDALRHPHLGEARSGARRHHRVRRPHDPARQPLRPHHRAGRPAPATAITELPPRGGRDSLRHGAAHAARPRRAPRTRRRSPAESGSRPLNAALEQLGRRGLRRGLVVVVSDLLGDPQTWSRSMRALTGRHQVLVVEIRDPRELELPSVGVLALTDPETGAELEVDTRSPGLRERYAQAAAAERAEVAAGAAQGARRPPRALHRFQLAARHRPPRRRRPALPRGGPMTYLAASRFWLLLAGRRPAGRATSSSACAAGATPPASPSSRCWPRSPRGGPPGTAGTSPPRCCCCRWSASSSAWRGPARGPEGAQGAGNRSCWPLMSPNPWRPPT